MGGRDLALHRGLLGRQLLELSLLLGDQPGQSLLFGDGVGEGVGPHRGRWSLQDETRRKQGHAEKELKEPPARSAAAMPR